MKSILGRETMPFVSSVFLQTRYVHFMRPW